MMSFNEPDPHEFDEKPSEIDEELDSLRTALARIRSDQVRTLKRTSLVVAQRDKYEAALRKIAAWQGYATAASETGEYEAGANDMAETLQAMAAEALS